MPTMTSAALKSFLMEPSGRSLSTKEKKKPAAPAVGSKPEEEEEEEEEDDDFLQPHESMSVASSCFSDSEDRSGSLCGIDGGGRGRRGSGSVSGHSEYYDAPEDLLSDGSFPYSSPSFSTSSKRELQALRCNLIEEVERRKKIRGGSPAHT
ncbi:uncharacterized protein M6B38_131490 [Iris pallida]|uniref:Uncharacterized protein n=1 Tax=Iris pallida TaxID=29817 RepID=A0AAX6FK10_IRIPA|nr:uncharacterized protein M6B38_415340 [Iris pallida]KAJ6818862.1 uncharacterized protein M6B38_131490 [Iris pallida]